MPPLTLRANTAAELMTPGPVSLSARVVDWLVAQVDYDGARRTETIAFHATGIQTQANELAQEPEGRIP